jgi:glycosyltransferase involved in cell wall biosynthesis
VRTRCFDVTDVADYSTRGGQWSGEGSGIPRVSIVIPTFNSSAYLASTIKSVLDQTFDNWQLLLSDDGSTDGTLPLAERLVADDDRISLIRGTHGGTAAARNLGLQSSDPRSEFVVFLDHDDTWEKDALIVLIQALEGAPECGAAYGLARAIDRDGLQLEGDDLADSMRRRSTCRDGRYVMLPPGSRTPFEAMLVENCVVTPGTSLIRRSALNAVGAFDPSACPADDWDLFIRLSRRSDILFVDRVILNWRRHPGAQSHHSKWLSSYFLVWAKTIKSSDNSTQHRQVALDSLLTHGRFSRRGIVISLRQGRFRDAARTALSVMMTYKVYVSGRLAMSVPQSCSSDCSRAQQADSQRSVLGPGGL